MIENVFLFLTVPLYH